MERAEALGMTAAELAERMTYAELVEWQALDGLRNAEQQKADRLSRKGMKRRF
mgnify:FL=1